MHISLNVERPDEFYEIPSSFVLYLLFFHSEVIIIFEVGIDNDDIQVADYSDLSVGSHITIWQLVKFCG